MIGYLKGEIVEKRPPLLVIDVAGVGYEVEASMNTFYRLPAVGTVITLHTHFVVREDAQLLYGFADQQERVLFRTLIKASGVGPKLALTILSGLNAEQLVRTIQLEDTATLIKVPGVGKKTAERLVVELRDRLSSMPDSLSSLSTMEQAAGHAPVVMKVDSARDDAESALVALGYKPVEATRSVNKAVEQLGESASSEQLIRLSLKSMVGG